MLVLVFRCFLKFSHFKQNKTEKMKYSVEITWNAIVFVGLELRHILLVFYLTDADKEEKDSGHWKKNRCFFLELIGLFNCKLQPLSFVQLLVLVLLV